MIRETVHQIWKGVVPIREEVQPGCEGDMEDVEDIKKEVVEVLREIHLIVSSSR